MEFVEVPTDTIKGSIQFFCQKLGAQLVEQTDHFAHLHFFEQEIIFHFDPTYREQNRSSYFTFVLPDEGSFVNIYKVCDGDGSIEMLRQLRDLVGHVPQKAFTVKGVSGHQFEFRYYLDPNLSVAGQDE